MKGLWASKVLHSRSCIPHLHSIDLRVFYSMTASIDTSYANVGVSHVSS